jgi:superoxide dismutase, Fe-Mn family
MIINRRNFFVLLGGATATACLGTLAKSALAQEQPQGPFKLTPLPYDYNALEPYIDAETMRFHHDKHYAAYIKKLNEAVSKYPELTSQTAEELLRNIDDLPKDVSTTIRNNGGGYVNHKMFWNIMSPDGGGEPTGEIAAAITETFAALMLSKCSSTMLGANNLVAAGLG